LVRVFVRLAAVEAHSDAAFTWGNITLLRVRDGLVEVRYDYDDEADPGDAIPLADFIDLLAQWRARVEARAMESSGPLPETYRRNPGR